MVWHAHLLNPRDFLEDCLRYDRIRLWKMGLPLATFNRCIDNETFEYCTDSSAPSQFQSGIGLPWNSLDDNQQAMIRCPNCARPMHVPWTTSITASAWREPFFGEYGRGLTDPSFETTCCGCQFVITHETLRVHKFQIDCRSLIEKNLPMPGTILNSKGTILVSNHPIKILPFTDQFSLLFGLGLHA